MRAIHATAPGGPEVLLPLDLPDPEPPPEPEVPQAYEASEVHEVPEPEPEPDHEPGVRLTPEGAPR